MKQKMVKFRHAHAPESLTADGPAYLVLPLQLPLLGVLQIDLLSEPLRNLFIAFLLFRRAHAVQPVEVFVAGHVDAQMTSFLFSLI